MLLLRNQAPHQKTNGSAMSTSIYSPDAVAPMDGIEDSSVPSQSLPCEAALPEKDSVKEDHLLKDDTSPEIEKEIVGKKEVEKEVIEVISLDDSLESSSEPLLNDVMVFIADPQFNNSFAKDENGDKDSIKKDIGESNISTPGDKALTINSSNEIEKAILHPGDDDHAPINKVDLQLKSVKLDKKMECESSLENDKKTIVDKCNLINTNVVITLDTNKMDTSDLLTQEKANNNCIKESSEAPNVDCSRDVNKTVSSNAAALNNEMDVSIISDDEVDSEDKTLKEDIKCKNDKIISKISESKLAVPVTNVLDILISDDESDNKPEDPKKSDSATEKAVIVNDKIVSEIDSNLNDKTTGVANDSLANGKEDKDKLNVISDDPNKAVPKPAPAVAVDDEDIILLDEVASEAKAGGTSDVDKPTDQKASPDDTGKTLSKDTKDEESIPEVPPAKAVVLQYIEMLKYRLPEMTIDELKELSFSKIIEAYQGSATNALKLTVQNTDSIQDELRKKVIHLSKQNRDLQIVVKTMNEELKRRTATAKSPMKINRSVGLQVGLPSFSRNNNRAAGSLTTANYNAPPKRGRQVRPPSQQNVTSAPPQQAVTPATNFNVPRGLPSVRRATPTATRVVSPAKPPMSKMSPRCATQGSMTQMPSPNILKNALSQSPSDPVRQSAEKRSQVQSIDLTDDEPANKQMRPYRPPAPAYANAPNGRMVGQMRGPRQIVHAVNNQMGWPRKPGPQMIRTIVPTLRPIHRMNHSVMAIGHIPIRPKGPQVCQHPAPLPPTPPMKHASPVNAKWIPPRPALKISKVENGIVISWEMQEFVETRHEEVASYQIYAYQETPLPPSSDLWKKIGDVKALPLPMACTLTHFNVGYKYYFAVRALDVRSRVGPFSMPGQIYLQ